MMAVSKLALFYPSVIWKLVSLLVFDVHVGGSASKLAWMLLLSMMNAVVGTSCDDLLLTMSL